MNGSRSLVHSRLTHFLAVTGGIITVAGSAVAVHASLDYSGAQCACGFLCECLSPLTRCSSSPRLYGRPRGEHPGQPAVRGGAA